MTFTRLRVSRASTNRLKALKARTGLTPNILSRLALCYSLADAHSVDPSGSDTDGVEFNRATLLGDRDGLYLALVRQRLANEGAAIEIEEAIRAHINRGIGFLSSRLKSVADVIELLPGGGSA